MGSARREDAGQVSCEAKLAQQLAFVEQEPLFCIFINLQKAYDAIDRERYIDICAEAGVGPNTVRLIVNF